MWFRTLFESMKHRRSGNTARRTSRPSPAFRLRVEALKGRCLPSFSPAVIYPVGADVSTVAGVNSDN